MVNGDHQMMEMRHALPETPYWSAMPIGTVWFSPASNAWRRQVGRAIWASKIIATDEYVWALRGRRYNR